MSRRVVITGLGAICGLGSNVEEMWGKVVKGESGIAPVTCFDMTQLRFRNGSDVKGYDPLKYYTPKQVDVMDKFAQFALIAAREAVADANIVWTDELKENSCVITGAGIGGQDSQEDAFVNLFKFHSNRVNLFTIPRIMPNAGASHITMDFGITGFAYTISTACASSNHAIGNAYWMIRNGVADMAITGGSETPFSLGFLRSWEVLRVIAPDTCRPFSKDRQGMILGEGGAMLVLETYESAIARGANIYAEIVGFGMSSDASHITKPDQKGPERAMKMAIRDAGIEPSQVDYINAHGTGTSINDSLEVAAIRSVFGEHANSLAISSTKSLHGHILGGTSAVEAVITALALKHQVFPPTANYTTPDPACDLDVVPNNSRKGKMDYAISNSFAFGGLNAVIVLKSVE